MVVSKSRISDEQGRTLILRGVNLGGSSKIPSNRQSGARSLEDPASVSFVGRPFPLEAAEEHFEKLKLLGLTFTRLIITWEALEHSGPGIYDETYLDYLKGILLIAEKKGISILMDPHQDVWSRWTGGDGAPAWTLEKLGFDLNKIDAVMAAVTMKAYSKYNKGKPYPQMIWPVNYSLYAAATMFSLFFGGNVFAPKITIEGESVQDFLSNRYIAAFCHCYRRLKNCRAIAAWGVINEPHPGFIGNKDLRGLENAALALGPVPNPFQAMMAASGLPVSVPVYTPWFKGWKAVGKKTINLPGLSLFMEGFSCPWKQAGVWDTEGSSESCRLLKPDYFSSCSGRPIRFTDDFLKPFIKRFIKKMEESGKTIFFIEGVPHSENPHWQTDELSGGPQNIVNAFHHYDGLTLFSKKFTPHFTVDNKTGRVILGKKKTAAFYSTKLAEAKAWARDNMNDMPCFLGEFGLPFDLNHKKAYKTGDYSLHEKALSLYYDGIDKNLLGSAIWNYTADNTNEDGDHWNREDLSIVSGGKTRAEGGWLRPYPMATAGIPVEFTWDRKKAVFYYRFRSDPAIEAPTEIFIPSRWFSEKPSISFKTSVTTGGEVSGRKSLRSEYIPEEQRLLIFNDGYDGEVELFIISSLKAKKSA